MSKKLVAFVSLFAALMMVAAPMAMAAPVSNIISRTFTVQGSILTATNETTLRTALQKANANDSIRITGNISLINELVINKPVKLVGGNLKPTVTLDAPIRVLASNVTIEGLAFVGTTEGDMITVEGANSLTIKNNTFTGHPSEQVAGIGVDLSTTSTQGAVIENNTFTNLYCGVYLNPGHTNVGIKGNTFTNMDDGAVVIDTLAAGQTVGATISGNTYTDGPLVYWYNSENTTMEFDNAVTFESNEAVTLVEAKLPVILTSTTPDSSSVDAGKSAFIMVTAQKASTHVKTNTVNLVAVWKMGEVYLATQSKKVTLTDPVSHTFETEPLNTAGTYTVEVFCDDDVVDLTILPYIPQEGTNYGVEYYDDNYFAVTFVLNKDIDVSKAAAVTLTYGYTDTSGTFVAASTEAGKTVVKNKLWSNYLGSWNGMTKYTGVIKAGQEISSVITTQASYVDAVFHAQISQEGRTPAVKVEVIDNAGNMDSQILVRK